MKKNTFLSIFLLILNSSFGQSIFDRNWGAATDNIPRIRISEIKKHTNELFFVNENNSNGPIYIYNPNNSTIKLFYQFPNPNFGTLVEQIKFDNNNNLIVYGRTHTNNLATPGTYSQIPISTIFTGYTFIAKINTEGKLVWYTYFHALSQYKSSLTIDKDNSIYIINLRNKNDVLSPSNFNKNGDSSSSTIFQDVISKLDNNGKHVWSTFYFNDNSELNSIVAANDGIYLYGVYLGNNSSNNYFSTSKSYQEYPNINTGNEKSTVFLAKLGFDGKRLWGTYFGNDVTKIPINHSSFPQSIVTIGNDVYFLSNIKSPHNQSKNLATSKSYINNAPYPIDNTLLTKFTGNGSREWSTYLYSGTSLQNVSINDLLITSNIYDNNSFLSNLTTSNAYQKVHGGNADMYTAILSNDGKDLKYGSFYGFDGIEDGVSVGGRDGFYMYGYTSGNSLRNSLFSTTNELLSGNVGKYYGRFISYFINKSLSSTNQNDEISVNIFPNPTTDILNIETKENLSINTSFVIYDVSGKKVAQQFSSNSNINQINVSNLTSGLYFLKIESHNTLHSFKFIKD